MNRASIGIVGCGTAGSAAASLLRRAGHRVSLYEAVEEPDAVGAGITLQPTGMQVLAQLGILGQVEARASRLSALGCVNSAGREVIHLAYADLHPRLRGLGVHRGVLFRALFRAAEEAGVEIHCGVDVASIDSDGSRATLIADDGRRFGPHDLVIVANGARSKLRPRRLVKRDKEYPWGAWWFVAEDPAGDFQRELRQVVDGTGVMIGLLPSGLGPSRDGVEDSPKVSFFYSLRTDADAELRAQGLERFKHSVLQHAPAAESVLAQITSFDQLLLARYRDVVMRRFTDGPVVFIGDAAHAMSPQLGQGANLALYDAMILAQCVSTSADVASALRAYEQSRRAHLSFCQFATRWLTPFFRSDHESLGWLRDVFMHPACRLPVTRNLMLRTMVGVKRGVVSRSLPLDAPLRALNEATSED